MAQLKVTQVKSKIGGNSTQRGTLRSLGLRKIGQSTVQPDTPRVPWHDPHGPPPGPRRGSGLAMLKLHDLRPAPGSHKEKQRLGRGEGSKGKTAGRGTKGTKARYQVPAGFEGGQMPLSRRLPKLKGFSNAQFKTIYQVVNVGRLAEAFPSGGEVTPETLAGAGAVRRGRARQGARRR